MWLPSSSSSHPERTNSENYDADDEPSRVDSLLDTSVMCSLRSGLVKPVDTHAVDHSSNITISHEEKIKKELIVDQLPWLKDPSDWSSWIQRTNSISVSRISRLLSKTPLSVKSCTRSISGNMKASRLKIVRGCLPVDQLVAVVVSVRSIDRLTLSWNEKVE